MCILVSVHTVLFSWRFRGEDVGWLALVGSSGVSDGWTLTPAPSFIFVSHHAAFLSETGQCFYSIWM